MAYTPSGNPTNQSRGLAATIRAEFALIAAAIAELAANAVQTLTNKTIALGSNTVSGTKAQFNTACTDGEFVYQSDLGSGVATFLATPTSTNLAAALTDETGAVSSGGVVFRDSPSIVTPQLIGAYTIGGFSVGALGVSVADNDTDGIITKGAKTYTFPAASGRLTTQSDGTWTPVLVTSGSGSFVYSQQLGVYTKTGKLVTVSGWVILSSHSVSSGFISLSGFPFSANSTNYQVVVGVVVDSASSFVFGRSQFSLGGSAIPLNTLGGVQMTQSNLTSTTGVYFQFSYQTD